MLKSDRLLKTISILLFIALTAYITVYVSASFLDPLKTTAAVMSTVLDLGRSEGVLVREEELIQSSLPNIVVVAKEGTRISAGSVIAVSYASDAALLATAKIKDLEAEIRALSSLRAASSPSGQTAGGALSWALLAVTGAVARHDTEALSPVAMTLKALVIQSQSVEDIDSRLQALYTELNQLRLAASVSAAEKELTQPRPGLFSTLLDGFETLSPDMLRNLTPSGVAALSSKKSPVSGDAIGKLVTGVRWYYAARLSAEYAARLTVGDSVSADFGRYLPNTLRLRVDFISEAENGERAVVFSCGEGLRDTLGLRLVTADIRFNEISGLRVPAGAIYYEEPGESGEPPQAFVYVYTALYAEKKKVTIVYEGDGYCLVSADTGPDDLREGNEIIIKANGLYNGKVYDN